MIRGVTPQVISVRASAYSRANSAGWTTSVRSRAATRPSAPPEPPRPSRAARPRPPPRSPASRSVRSTSGSASRSGARHSSRVARNTGSRRYSSATIPGYCSPTPASRNATGRPWTVSTRLSTPGSADSPLSVAAASSTVTVTVARRCSKVLRPTWSVYATSASRVPGSARRCAPRRSHAWSAAVALRAEIGSTW